MLFGELPPDHLELVVAFLKGCEIGNLWFCGNNKLNWKLSRGGAVKHFELSYSSRFGVVWPSLLAEFGVLESLVISVSSSRGNFPAFVPEYEKVSPCLKKLDISFPFSISYLKQAQEKHGVLFPNLEEFVYNYEFDTELEVLSVTKKWPKLSKLALSGSLDDTRISSSDFSPSLTDICVSGYCVELSDSQLPSNLLRLEMVVTKCSDFFGSLPRSLQHMDISFQDSSNANDVHHWKWAELPPHLTSLTVGCCHFNVQNAQALPSRLLNLRIDDLEISDAKRKQILKVLPKTLTRLPRFAPDPINIGIARSLPPALALCLFEDIEWNAVPHLPPTLERIRLVNDDLRVPVIERFPPSLQTLATGLIDPELAAKFPKTLTSLNVTKGNMSLESVKSLPRNLRILLTLEGQAFESIECLKYLPDQLSLLDATSIYLESERERLLPALLAPPESSSWLPRNLTVLSLGPLDLPDSAWFSHLPPLLETLKLCVDSLPPDSLLQLQKYKISELEIQARFTPVEGVSHFIITLPRTLERFTWRNLTHESEESVDSDILDEHLMNLPPWLYRFVIPKSNLDGSCAPHLPTYLVTLLCGGDAPKWFDLLVHQRNQQWSVERNTPQISNEDMHSTKKWF